jgi:hypothetical protein
MRDQGRRQEAGTLTKPLKETTTREFGSKHGPVQSRKGADETPGERAIKKIRADFARRVNASA